MDRIEVAEHWTGGVFTLLVSGVQRYGTWFDENGEVVSGLDGNECRFYRIVVDEGELTVALDEPNPRLTKFMENLPKVLRDLILQIASLSNCSANGLTMRYSESKKNGFRQALAECTQAGKLFSIIHDGRVLYNTSWRKTNGRHSFELAFTVRHCFGNPELNKIYKLEVGQRNLMLFPEHKDLIHYISEMINRNCDFRENMEPDWKLTQFADELNGLTSLEIGP